MPDSNETKWGFPKGRVAKTLREILHRELTDHDVEVVSVVLFGHLLLEKHLNRIFYMLIAEDMPRMGAGRSEAERLATEKANQEMEDSVWKEVRSARFSAKLAFIRPGLKMWYPEVLQTIEAINKVRNAIFHDKESEKVEFEGSSIWSEEGIEKYFIAVQMACSELPRFAEMIDAPHARAERWAQRLRDLGEPLY
jgi:hypothetical protein